MTAIVTLLIFFFTKQESNKTNSNIVQKLISLMWIYFGYKTYLSHAIEQHLFFYNNNTIDMLSGAASLIIGLMLFMNYIKFYQGLKSVGSIFGKLTLLGNFLFMNSNYGIFDFSNDRLQKYSQFIYFFFILLNSLSISLNSLVGNSIYSRYTNIKFFPNYISLSCFTLFLLCFKHDSYNNLTYFMVEIICVLLICLNIFKEISINRFFTIQNIFFITLCILNIVVLYFIPTSFVNNSTATKEIMSSISFTGFLIRESLLLDAGLDGFYGVDLFIDEYKNIANDFLEITADFKILSLKANDKSSTFDNIKPINKEEISSKQMRNVYPKYNNITN